MPEWGKVPWSMWAYAVLAIGGGTTLLLVSPPKRAPVAAVIVLIAVSLTWVFFLLSGIRWLWIATVVSFVLFSALDIVDGNWKWPGGLLGVAQIALLLLPASQRFFAKDEAVTAT